MPDVLPQVGDAWPGFETEPVSRLTLALYCSASGDHNPIHVDSDYARSAGQPDVFAHGMLAMALLARVLTRQVPQAALRSFGVRFVAITHVGDALRCDGRVAEVFGADGNGERRVRVELTACDRAGEVKLAGHAVVALA